MSVIGLIGAMDEEVAVIKEWMTDVQETSIAGCDFFTGQLDGKDVQYIIKDVLQVKIEPTDMLFIDTWHSQRQLRQELAMHGNVPTKYLAFHDTHTYGTVDESMEWA